MTLYAVIFHVIKLNVEHEQHSWVTGFYWTLVVMTTLGFGDVTFTSDTGRVFSIIVLVSGVVFLLVMLPFLFIRLFYAPWLEARVRLRAPREVAEGTRGHVIIAEYDPIAAGLAERLAAEGIPYVVIEPDPGRAAQLFGDRLSVLTGENDNRRTYERAAAPAARMLIANCEDTINTNITLTVREVAPELHVVAIVEEMDSVDVLELSGASSVLPLKHQLGDYLANRADAGRPEAHVVGEFRGLQIAELPAHDLPFVGQTVRETRLRQQTGVSVVGFWERGKLHPAYPDTGIRADSVLVVAGSAQQIAALNALLPPGDGTLAPVLVIGAGKVGQGGGSRAQVQGISRARARSDGGRAGAACGRRRRGLRGGRGRPAGARTRRYPPGAIGAAHDQRGRHEHLPGGLLPAPEREAAHREPHHPRAQSRSDPSGRGRFRPELHHARDRGGDVAAARLSAGDCWARASSCSRSPSRRRSRIGRSETPASARAPASR